MDAWIWEALKIAFLFGWLFLVLPIFTGVHQRFSLQVFSTPNRAASPLSWFLDLGRVLGQRSTLRYSIQKNSLGRALVLISLISSTTILSMLPLAILEKNAGHFSLYFAFALIFLIGFVYTTIGFSFDTSLIPLTALEQFFSRQSIVLVIAFASLSCPIAEGAADFGSIVINQALPLFGPIPSWGALINPPGFIAACIALAFYTRQWFDNEIATQGILRKPIESRLTGTLLLTFKIALNLEYLTLYALLTTIFLGGPLLGAYPLHPFLGVALFTVKLFLLVALVLSISHLLPRFRDEQVVRVMLLYLLPFAALGYLSIKWLTSLWAIFQ